MSKRLHFHTYCNGSAGLNNVLMSIENGLIIGKLLDRKVIFYYGKDFLWSGNKIPQSTNKYIQDLYDIDAQFIQDNVNLSIKNIPINLTDGICYYNQEPDEDFAFGRKDKFNLADLDKFEDVRTKSHLNLSFYSYLFYLNKFNQNLIRTYLKKAIVPKMVYKDFGDKISNKFLKLFGNFNLIHLRRGNTLTGDGLCGFDENGNRVNNLKAPELWKDVPVSSFIEKLTKNLNVDIPLIILGDESKDFYHEILNCYKNVIILNQHTNYIGNINLNFFEELERWFIFSFIGLYADNFIGTQGSTYSSMIQRERLKINNNEKFKFLYPQGNFSSLDDNFCMKEAINGSYSWNRCYKKGAISPAWSREWPESVINY